MILAQQVVPISSDPLGGWGSLVLQGGAFGLLAYIVIYLTPRLLKDAREERDRREKTVIEERAAREEVFRRMADVMQDRFDERSKQIIMAVEIQTASLVQAGEQNTQEIKDALAGTCRASHPPKT